MHTCTHDPHNRWSITTLDCPVQSTACQGTLQGENSTCPPVWVGMTQGEECSALLQVSWFYFVAVAASPAKLKACCKRHSSVGLFLQYWRPWLQLETAGEVQVYKVFWPWLTTVHLSSQIIIFSYELYLAIHSLINKVSTHNKTENPFIKRPFINRFWQAVFF